MLQASGMASHDLGAFASGTAAGICTEICRDCVSVFSSVPRIFPGRRVAVCRLSGYLAARRGIVLDTPLPQYEAGTQKQDTKCWGKVLKPPG